YGCFDLRKKASHQALGKKTATQSATQSAMQRRGADSPPREWTMEFKIEKGTLLSGLYLAQGIADRKSTMPILANVLIRTEGRDQVLVAATDLNVTVTAELPAKIQTEGGITLGARHLHAIVKALPGD